MRFLFVTTVLPRADAVGEYVYSLANALVDRGNKVVIICNKKEFPERDNLEICEVYSQPKAILSTFWEKFDVIMVHVASADFFKFLTPIMKSRDRCKLVVDYHGITPIKFVYKPTLKLSLLAERLNARLLVRYADYIWVHSEYMYDEVSKKYEAGKKTSIHPLYAKEEYRILDKKGCKTKLDIDRKAILYVGRLEKHKRVDFLLDSFARIAKKQDKPMLIIVGEGACKKEIENKIKTIGLEDSVRLIGRLSADQLCEYYNACDVFATASIHEGFCIPIIESLSCGTPVVGTNVSAIPSTIGEFGYTFSINDVEGCANALEQVLAWSIEERKKFEERANLHMKKYSKKAVIERMAEELCNL